MKVISRKILLLTFLLSTVTSSFAQDIEPRRWTPIPLDKQVIGVGYAHSTGDILFDPVLLVEEAKYDLNILGISYVSSFKFLDKLARLDLKVPMAKGTWDGLVDGEPTTVNREGLLDPQIRLSVNFIGTPAENAKGLRNYLANKKSNTVVGASVTMTLPLGEYFNDKIINLGQNRYTFRPQVGVVHTNGNWSYELTGSAFIHTDNNNFYSGKKREQKPLYTLQTHVIYSLNAGKWVSVSAGYGIGGISTVDGVTKNDKRHMLLSALSFGMPISKTQSVKVAYWNGQTNSSTGNNFNSLFFTFAQLF